MSFNSQGNTRYSGSAGDLFRLAFGTGLLTIVTVGLYRFWAKTRLRKYIWSSTSVDGDAFEYTGTGLEKLLGFLVAIVFLAVYLAIVQLLLTFLGLGLVLGEPGSEAEAIAQIASIYLSFFAVVPFLFFAIYRSRRYKLARTRLRGIRFGMENAAWGYAFRAIGHYLLTFLTLGILLPRQTFYLEKYMTDRTQYGDAKFEQGGRWQALYGSMKHIFIGLSMMIGGGVAAGLVHPVLAVLSAVGYIWLMVGFVYYRVRSFAYLAGTKTLGGAVSFSADPKTGFIVGKLVIGTLVLGIVSAISIGIVVAVGVAVFQLGGGSADAAPGAITIIVILLAGISLFVGLGALSLVLITQPIIAHIVRTLHVNNAEALATIRQRAYDAGADADGFADALDVGGAI